MRPEKQGQYNGISRQLRTNHQIGFMYSLYLSDVQYSHSERFTKTKKFSLGYPSSTDDKVDAIFRVDIQLQNISRLKLCDLFDRHLQPSYFNYD